ncbi:hypothetical protein WJX77_001686 [Trebouxia sp. C0004]
MTAFEDMESVTNNRFRSTPMADQSRDSPTAAASEVSVGVVPPTKTLYTVHEEETNGHIPAGRVGNGNSKCAQARGTSFSLKQVRRNISKQLSLDDFDWDAAKRRNEQIEQIALNDQEQYDLPLKPQSKVEKAWIGFLGTLSDTFLVARLALKLFAYLGGGGTWVFRLLRLCLYTCLLMPGFAQMVFFYFLSSRVIRSVAYGKKPRQRLDIFVPKHHWKENDTLRPVVIYVTGGAWTIGYKAWGSLLGRRLSKHGCLVCCLDYRNCPQGTIVDMLEDVNTGIGWVLQKISNYGGDPEQVYLVGQSCGGQLCSLTTLLQAEQAIGPQAIIGGTPKWDVTHLRGLVGVSGVYNCADLRQHFNQRGLYFSLFDRIMSFQGKTQLKALSPTYVVHGAQYAHLMPPVLLLHGTKDTCAPLYNAKQFHQALHRAGIQSTLKIYEGETHTSPLVENPMRGGTDKLMDDILSMVKGEEVITVQYSLCPGFLVTLAAWVCPF